MSRNDALIADAERRFLPTYRRAPLVLTRGDGRHVEDVDGRRYLDLTGGIAVTSLGHGHPDVVAAIAAQAARLMHTSNAFHNDRAIELAARLTARTGFARVFLCNSGAEANEALIKLGRGYQRARGRHDRTTIIAARGSFHGRTLGALSLTGQERYRVGFAPLLGGVTHVAFDDLDAMQRAIEAGAAAVVLEAIQIDRGLHEPSAGYLHAVRELCRATDTLLCIDEVQTGYGRTGRFLAHEWSGVRPDACSVAKGIANGFPMAAIVVDERVADGFGPGAHASTFGGNPLACAAALAVLDAFERDDLVARVDALGAVLRDGLDALVNAHPGAVAVRGRGLLQGLALADGVDAAAVIERARAAGVLLTAVDGPTLRVSPALTITEDELAHGLAALGSVL